MTCPPASSAPVRSAVIPTTPGSFSIGSSIELPLGSVEPGLRSDTFDENAPTDHSDAGLSSDRDSLWVKREALTIEVDVNDGPVFLDDRIVAATPVITMPISGRYVPA